MARILERAKFEEIMEGDSLVVWEGDNGLIGLNIIAKYFPSKKTDILCGADHDIIYSVGVKELLDGGITEEDAKALRDINWMIQDDYMACYV